MTSTAGVLDGTDIGVLVADLARAAARLARAAAPDHGPTALAQADVLLEARGFVELATEARVSKVERTGAAQAAGYASVAAWLRNGGRSPADTNTGNTSNNGNTSDNGNGSTGGDNDDGGGGGGIDGNGACDAGTGAGGGDTGGDGSGTGDGGIGGPGGGRRGGRMSRRQAGVVRRNALQFRRLPRVLAAVRAGLVSHEVASAIAAALAALPTDCEPGEVADFEQILLELALDAKTTPEKIAYVGRYLRAARNPDGDLSDEDKMYGKRYLAVGVDDKGGMLGRFYLPPEAAAKLQQILDDYAGSRDAADDRTVIARNADALIQALNHKVATQICLLINAETLPDSHPHHPNTSGSGSGGDAAADSQAGGSGSTESHGGAQNLGGAEEGEANAPADAGAAAGEEARAAAGGGAVEEDDGWLGPDGLDERAREQVRVTLANLAQAPPVVEPDPLACDGCGRPANRNTPALLLPTGHPMPAAHARKLLYTSQIFRVVLNTQGRVIDTSYSMRIVPDWMKRNVHLQYATCSYDDCPVEAKYCQMDHVFGWAEYQRTRPDEIIPACSWHNRDRAMHPHKYRLEKLPNDHWHFTSTKQQN